VERRAVEADPFVAASRADLVRLDQGFKGHRIYFGRAAGRRPPKK
jgi:hypothetical protein